MKLNKFLLLTILVVSGSAQVWAADGAPTPAETALKELKRLVKRGADQGTISKKREELELKIKSELSSDAKILQNELMSLYSALIFIGVSSTDKMSRDEAFDAINLNL